MGTTTTEQTTYELGTTTDTVHLDPLAFGGAAAAVSAAVMLLFGIFGNIGVYEGAVEMMQQWHLFFEPTLVGTITGMVEAAVISFVLVYALAVVYNVFAR